MSPQRLAELMIRGAFAYGDQAENFYCTIMNSIAEGEASLESAGLPVKHPERTFLYLVMLYLPRELLKQAQELGEKLEDAEGIAEANRNDMERARRMGYNIVLEDL